MIVSGLEFCCHCGYQASYAVIVFILLFIHYLQWCIAREFLMAITILNLACILKYIDIAYSYVASYMYNYVGLVHIYYPSIAIYTK